VAVRPQLAGMASGDEGDALPPVVLRFTLHGRYPSDDPPAFSVSSAWMRREDEENVKRAMTALFEEQKGSVILFSWVEW
jgi:E3 ubiquitin-protein ligase RNF14